MKKHLNFLYFIGLGLCTLVFSCETDLGADLTLEAPSLIKTKKRDCGKEQHMDKLLSNPEYVKERNLRLLNFEKISKQNILKAQCSTPLLIPVAVHYQGIGTTDKACLIDLAQRQIEVLNKDFGGLNSDISKWKNQAAAYFPGVVNGEACIRFVIANQNHPAGYNLSNGQVAVTFNQTQGDQVNKWAGYLNIFVQFNTGYLGYAPYGGLGNGDGVVIDAEGFGVGNGCGSLNPVAPFNLGRTTTHEVGHYLFLEHIWADGCSTDDEVSDTPNQAQDYSGCPNLGASSCGSIDMHMNYMDYTDDACMYMFSKGQTQRMENYISSSLQNLRNNAANVYSSSGSSNGGDTGGGTEGNNPTCSSPDQATVSSINESTYKIVWQKMTQASSYGIRYRVSGSSLWTNQTTTISEYNLSQLTAGTSYEYQLRSKCPSGWTIWSKSLAFSTKAIDTTGDNTNSGEYKVRLVLDDYGSETTWYIVDKNLRDVAFGGPYKDFEAGTIKEKTVKLAKGCYELELNDDYGDGFCCDYGNGSIALLDSKGKVLASSTGKFGYFKIIKFCVDNGSARITKEESDEAQASVGTKKKSVR